MHAQHAKREGPTYVGKQHDQQNKNLSVHLDAERNKQRRHAKQSESTHGAHTTHEHTQGESFDATHESDYSHEKRTSRSKQGEKGSLSDLRSSRHKQNSELGT
jgi:hypothetical protein